MDTVTIGAMIIVGQLIAIVVGVVAVVGIKSENRNSKIRELQQLILKCDTHQIPFRQIELFCSENGFSDQEYHDIRKALYYEKAKSDDIFALKMAAAYASNENCQEEIQFLTRAAELGDADSMYSLGVMLKYDVKCPGFPNLEKAFYWFNKAANAGNERAVAQVARALREGEGVAKDDEKAFELLKRYADMGYFDCAFDLAFYYYRSRMSHHYNIELAIRIYNVILRRGEPEHFAKAADSLGRIYGASYLYNIPEDAFSDRRKAAYCFALAHFVDPDLYDKDELVKTGYRWTQNEMKLWHEDAKNLRYNPV